MKTALVTGHLGFAGRHYKAELEVRGWKVDGIDLGSPLGGDARRFFLSNDSRGYDLVVNCAAVVGGREVIDGAPLALAANLELDAGFFQWAARVKPGRIVYLSSSAVYPVHRQQLRDHRKLVESDVDPMLAGDTVGIPDQLYGWAKLTGEHLAVRARAAGLSVTVVRPFSGYGSDQDKSYPFRAFTERAKAREDPFEIWGSGQQVRDFIHIDDIVAATLLMVHEDRDGPVNLGTGRAVSMSALARMFCAAAGYSPFILPRRDAPTGVSYRVADSTALTEFYQPRVLLEDGIRRALQERIGAR